ncbi:aminomethyl-transferring glycine dehydrogenase subunit GcvPA [Desulfovibrionales bacterium]
MPFIPHTPADQKAMLATIGVPDIEALFADIPSVFRAPELRLPPGLSELDVRRKLERIALKNHADLISFLGAGFYDHDIPSAVDALSGRGEFYTAYTPYQAEASQGILQAIFEYQTAMARLMDLPFANASLYDGGTALYEAVMMAVRHTKRTRVVVCETVNPIYRVMLASYTTNLHMELVTIPHVRCATDMAAITAALDDSVAALIVQNPNFFGTLEDFTALFATARQHKIVPIMSVYPIMQTVLQTPGHMGADIAVAEGQCLGLPLSFGGPYLGIMTCSKQLVRQMPGRVVGRTTDQSGKTGYVLTLQAREQHIRREKATSNICSNQALCALRALIYVSLLGPEGLRRTAQRSMSRARYAAERLGQIPGVRVVNQTFANEFTLELPCRAYTIIDRLIDAQLIPGFPLGRYYSGMDNHLLVACTEKTTRQDIGILAEHIGGAL